MQSQRAIASILWLCRLRTLFLIKSSHAKRKYTKNLSAGNEHEMSLRRVDRLVPASMILIPQAPVQIEAVHLSFRKRNPQNYARTMISIAFAAVGLQSPLVASRVGSSRVSAPVMVTRRDVFNAVVVTAVASTAVEVVSPLPANAYENGQSKAKAIFGQKVLKLVDASPDTILDNQAALETYVSQIIRSTGKRNVDGRRLGGTPLGDAAVEAIAAAHQGDKAAANTAVKKIVTLTKLTKIAPLGTKENPFPGGNSFSSLSGTTGKPGSW